MRLSALIAALPPDHGPEGVVASVKDDDPVIRGLVYDSRAVAAGDLFFALRGAHSDGHDHLSQALDLGAAALVVEELPKDLDRRDRPAVVVRDSRRALAPIATRFFGEPSSELELIGITGTNGKTSTSYLCESILARAGRRVGLVGTVEIRHPGKRQRAVNTTPESLDLQRTLRAMRTANVDAVVMEVSSHGLELGRVEGCRFSVGAFTNLTQDHLDFHGSMAAYRAAKALLFARYLRRGGHAVINIDDPSAPAFESAALASGATLIRTTRDPAREAEVCLEQAEIGLGGTRAVVRTPLATLELELPLVGAFNLENMLVACGVACALGQSPEAIRDGVAACPQVPGRVQRVGAELPGAPTVLVDYAHTPDAVEKLLQAVRPLTPGRLLTVFGCGGDRDRGKRPLMAEAVARFSDRIVATSDNPRTEDPARILSDVEAGLRGRRRVEPEQLADADDAYVLLPDRRRAIQLAIAAAREGDSVVIAGKGHEDYQIIGREKLPFDDCDEARRALAARERP